MKLTNEELEKAEQKVKLASDGKFFKTNNARLLPSFDRGGDEETSDTDGKYSIILWFVFLS